MSALEYMTVALVNPTFCSHPLTMNYNNAQKSKSKLKAEKRHLFQFKTQLGSNTNFFYKRTKQRW